MAKKQTPEVPVEEVVVEDSLIPTQTIDNLPTQNITINESTEAPAQVGHSTRAFRS